MQGIPVQMLSGPADKRATAGHIQAAHHCVLGQPLLKLGSWWRYAGYWLLHLLSSSSLASTNTAVPA